MPTLTPQELQTAIESLSEADRTRLKKAAEAYSRGRRWEADDLLQEAILRALSHKRRCPRSVPVVRFLNKTMRSIASSDAKRAKKMDLHSLDYELEDPTPSVEERLSGRQEAEAFIATLKALFPGDESAQLIIEEICRGAPRAEILKRAGIDGNKLASEWKRIRRRIDRKFPKGRKP